MKKYWVCLIEVNEEAELPEGFDSVPRRAVIEAIEKDGVIDGTKTEYYTGWGCSEEKFKKIMKIFNG